MDEVAFAKWVDGVEEQFAQYVTKPWVCAYAEPTVREAEMATAELQRRGYNIIVLSVKSTQVDGDEMDGPVYGLLSSED